jgi:hypothetical protein
MAKWKRKRRYEYRRTTITIPSELKVLMELCDKRYQINWSAIASTAFQEVVDEIARDDAAAFELGVKLGAKGDG